MVNADLSPSSPATPRRSTRQTQQREQTRARLLDAAGAVFAEQGYLATTVEHVLARADVSRAGFYAHFDGKLALVLAIAEAFTPEWMLVYDALADLPATDLGAIEDWAGRYVDVYRCSKATCVLLTQVAAIEDALYDLLAAQRDALIRRLAERIPAFARALQEPLMRTRAELLLAHLDQTCFILAHRHLALDVTCGPKVMAEHLQLFLNADADAGAPASGRGTTGLSDPT